MRVRNANQPLTTQLCGEPCRVAKQNFPTLRCAGEHFKAYAHRRLLSQFKTFRIIPPAKSHGYGRRPRLPGVIEAAGPLADWGLAVSQKAYSHIPAVELQSTAAISETVSNATSLASAPHSATITVACT